MPLIMLSIEHSLKGFWLCSGMIHGIQQIIIAMTN